MKEIPQNVSESVRRRNPELYGQGVTPPAKSVVLSDSTSKTSTSITLAPTAKRVRQRSAPKLNKLESQWLEVLCYMRNLSNIRAQAKTYVLGNGVRYTPDFTGYTWSGAAGQGGTRLETAWEVKGPWATDDALVKLKVAASVWPEVRWVLVWKDKAGQWQQQEILPH